MSNDLQASDAECGMDFERLSALVDGELGGAEVGRACSQWREHADTRATWHAYHLIGDVLRSDDLAATPGRDTAFLNKLRSRLATEPVVLAPQAMVAAPAASSSRRSWWAPTAVAAGVVAVVGVLTVARPGLGPNRLGSETVAQLAPVSTSSVAPAPVSKSAIVPDSVSTTTRSDQPFAAEPTVLIATDQLIRDARLDQYLMAHKQFAGSSALGVPSGYLRSAAIDVSGR